MHTQQSFCYAIELTDLKLQNVPFKGSLYHSSMDWSVAITKQQKHLMNLVHVKLMCNQNMADYANLVMQSWP